MPLNIEKAHQYRTLFKFVKVLIIDEVSMVSAELLEQINTRLKQITGLFTKDFGGLEAILIGDLQQLSPVKATPIFK
ncbi:ATP-dependent DNA helicase [Trichonephila clavata]|uniref:ATP-dependent DNA helicase n=1 Tax=Trichonephila clavata TaxID=2740835 RepID=A0A8X6LIA1_TRICU|nr:ATP-dependent DNA helicase [Trichonephila clavata]